MYNIKRIYKSEIFQGKNKDNNYFEGWYFKLIDERGLYPYSIIPGVSIGDNIKKAISFIQVIDGTNGKTYYFKFNYDDFKYSEKEFSVEIKDNIFTDYYMKLNLENKKIKIVGKVYFSEIVKLPKSIINPGIMGVFSYMPFMECRHGVINIHHKIKGQLRINDVMKDFTNGNGYIEKDWGTSFPSSWVWIQANDFDDEGSSFMLSIAKIPFAGTNFIGFLGFLYTDKKVHRFASYNFSFIKKINYWNKKFNVIIKKGKYEITAIAQQSLGGLLKAPKNGNMDAYIEESLNAHLEVKLTKNNKVIFEKSSSKCGMEISSGINELIKDVKIR